MSISQNKKINQLLGLNSEIKKNIDWKGFYMYEWISFEELRTTFSRDYLYVLSKIIILFWVVFVWTWLYDYYINWWFYLFLQVLTWLYLLLFLILVIRMIYRSWIFMHISHIFFTNTHISIWWNILEYNNFYEIEDDIKHYEELFDEELMKASKVNEKISEFKAKVFNWSAQKQEKKAQKYSNWFGVWGCDVGGCDIWEWAIPFIILTFVLIWLYWVSIRLFYFIWWIFSFIIWYIFVWIMKIIIYIQDKEELKINSLFEKIENISKEIIFSKELLTKKISEASNWNWSEGVTWIVSNFDNTIWKARITIWLINKLRITLLHSKFNNIFSFSTYNLWTKNQILEPINNIISLINTSLEKLQKTISNLELQINKTDKSLTWAMEVQLFRLKEQENKFLITQKQWAWIWAKIVLQDF